MDQFNNRASTGSYCNSMGNLHNIRTETYKEVMYTCITEASPSIRVKSHSTGTGALVGPVCVDTLVRTPTVTVQAFICICK